MPIIAQITASIGGKVTGIGTASPGRRIEAASPPRERVVFVPRQALALLQRASIRPPEREGQLLDIGEVDRLLAASDLTTSEKLTTKTFLCRAGLVNPGRLIG
jgi:hypothetical protein